MQACPQTNRKTKDTLLHMASLYVGGDTLLKCPTPTTLLGPFIFIHYLFTNK